MATIINKPVYGYKQRDTAITARELLGDVDEKVNKAAPNALRAFIEEGARIQKAQKEAQRG